MWRSALLLKASSSLGPIIREKEKGRAVDVACLDFSKAFDTVSHNSLIGKLRKCGLDEWTVR